MHRLILISFRSQSNLFFFPGDFGFLPLAAVLELIWKLRTPLRTSLTCRHNVQSHGARFSFELSEHPSVSSGSGTTHTALFSLLSELLSEEQSTKTFISDLVFIFPLLFWSLSCHWRKDQHSSLEIFLDW